MEKGDRVRIIAGGLEGRLGTAVKVHRFGIRGEVVIVSVDGIRGTLLYLPREIEKAEEVGKSETP